MKIIIISFSLLILYRFLQYITTPLLRKIGFYRYFSPLFFIMPVRVKTYEIHLGTSWDFFRLNKKKPKIFLFLLLEGLLNLIRSIENNTIPVQVTFYGKIHFFKKETLERFGFHIKKLNLLDYILFAFHYLELLCLKVIVFKSFNPPDISKVTKISFTAEELITKKELLSEMYNHIKNSIDQTTYKTPQPRLVLEEVYS